MLAEFLKQFEDYKEPTNKDQFMRDVIEHLGIAMDPERYGKKDGLKKFAPVINSLTTEIIYGKQK